MNPTRRTEISEIGEFGLIKEITKNIIPNQDTVKSVGDDGAVIKSSKENTVISTDLLIEGIHFDLSYTPLKHLGYKAVVVNISDIYAMNATPKHITVSLALSNRFSVEAVNELYEGIYLACEKYNIDVIGGDTTASDKGLVISITAIGEADNKNITYRNGAKAGDIICVTGNFGAAYLGLQVLIREKQIFLDDPSMEPELNDKNAYLIQRILKPEAQKQLIDFFATKNIKPNSMIDVSDGLSSELLHICTQSEVGLVIEEANIPIDEEAYHQAMAFNFDPTVAALSGGEDYELLFTIDPKYKDIIESNTAIHIIGEIKNKSEGIKIKTRGGGLYDITAQGWNSFAE